MEFYFMQHGKASPKEKDPEEGLSDEGRAAVYASAIGIEILEIHFDHIVTSPKKRARETAEIIADKIAFPRKDIIKTEKVKATVPPEESVEEIAKFLPFQSLLICGHLPSIQAMASFLLFKEGGVDIDIQNASLLKISVEDLFSHSGKLMSFLTAEQLKLIGS